MVGLSLGGFASELSLDGDAEISEQMVVGSIGRQLGNYSLRGAVGAILGGMLESSGVEHDIGAGWLVTVSGSRRWVRGSWFATASLTAGVSSTHTTVGAGDSTSLTATDLRLGLIGGLTVADRVSPYLVARGFGGPVSWGEVTGSDKHHYQLGAGVALALPRELGLLVDLSVFGERALSIGGSLAF